MKKEFFSNNEEETLTIAKSIASFCEKNCTVLLRGDLGSGKTTFVKGFAKFFNINDEVTSPSFAIFNIYHGDVDVVHMDAYRLHSADDFDNLMVDDFLIEPFIFIVEWPDVVLKALPEPAMIVELIDVGDGKRKITLNIHEKKFNK